MNSRWAQARRRREAPHRAGQARQRRSARAGRQGQFGDYLTDRWLPLQQAQLRPTTFDSYRRNLELHVIPAIGRIPLHKLAPEDLDTLYARLLTAGRRDGTGGAASRASAPSTSSSTRHSRTHSARAASSATPPTPRTHRTSVQPSATRSRSGLRRSCVHSSTSSRLTASTRPSKSCHTRACGGANPRAGLVRRRPR